MTADAIDAPIVRCDDLSVVRGRHRVVDGVTFALARGGALTIGGSTGAGKSSLVRLLAGDDQGLRAAGGDARVLGTAVRRRGRARRVRLFSTGFVAQDAGSALPARLTVSEVVAEPITSRDPRVNQRALAVRVARLLDELELPLGAAAKYPYELSAGMRQRVALARALVLEPPLFVGDETYAGLDVEVRHAVRDALARRRHEGMALLLVSGDLDVARELHAGVVVLRHGHVVARGDSADALVWTPGHDARLAV